MQTQGLQDICCCWGAGPCQAMAQPPGWHPGWHPELLLLHRSCWCLRFPPRAASMWLSCLWSCRRKSWAIRAAVLCTATYCHIDFKDLNTKWFLSQTHRVSCAPCWCTGRCVRDSRLAQGRVQELPGFQEDLTQTAPEILQPNKRVGAGGSHLCYITSYPGRWTWPEAITMAQVRPYFTL